MNITLQHTDIEQAVRMYIQSQGISLQNKNLDVKFAMGRKGNGLTTVLHIYDALAPLFKDEGDVTTSIAKAPPTAKQIKAAKEVAPVSLSEAITATLVPATVAEPEVVAAAPVIEAPDPVDAVLAEADPVVTEVVAVVETPVELVVETAPSETPIDPVVVPEPAKVTTSLFG